MKAKDVITNVVDLIKRGGGPDGHYTLFENTPEIQPYTSDDDYVVQAIHSTMSFTYNDTMHIAAVDIPSATVTSSKLTIFSHSQVRSCTSPPH